MPLKMKYIDTIFPYSRLLYIQANRNGKLKPDRTVTEPVLHIVKRNAIINYHIFHFLYNIIAIKIIHMRQKKCANFCRKA